MPDAHSANSSGHCHELEEHLNGVARLASGFAGKFGASELALWAGRWHDLGKIHPGFQAYLQRCSIDPETAGRGPDHKAAGALFAAQLGLDILAFVIAGHHAGIPTRANLKAFLRDAARQSATEDSVRLFRQTLRDVEPPSSPPLPAFVSGELDTEFFIRMLFSTLVDADFLDTEAHFHPEQAHKRGACPDIAELCSRFEQDQELLMRVATGRVNQIRREVFRACIAASAERRGFFRLTVPTGGGKTRSALGFALDHAQHHGLDRVITVIPYTSIIEQTADVYRDILDDVVLEHHSAVAAHDSISDPVHLRQDWARLASENWDAPVVVTTTVQFFESLFGHRTRSCRKLHNIARSVVILDEVQMLPTGLLEPILNGLRQLVAHYGVSVLLCTATQPALDDSPYLKGLPDIREIVPDPGRIFAELGSRVEFQYPESVPWSWDRAADRIRSGDQVLAIVNTKRDAMALLAALDDPEALHLSNLLCGAHRRDVLANIRDRLSRGNPCRVVATQVVEAGVDLDFPLVMRAVGPLDRIVQAAGRCNREGRLSGKGEVVIFAPADGTVPPGGYKTGTELSKNLLAQSGCNLQDPTVYYRYFRLLYQAEETDAKQIQPVRKEFDFPEVARRFRLIDDDTVPVVVMYRAGDAENGVIDRLMVALEQQHEGPSRWLMRQLQPYLVNIPRRFIPGFLNDGSVVQIKPGLWEWRGNYDATTGIGVCADRTP